jgi:hypothetical protein
MFAAPMTTAADSGDLANLFVPVSASIAARIRQQSQSGDYSAAAAAAAAAPCKGKTFPPESTQRYRGREREKGWCTRPERRDGKKGGGERWMW